MSRAHLRVSRVVWIDFNANPEIRFPQLPAHAPLAPLVLAFLEWQAATGIYAVRQCGGATGPGIYRAAFREQDADLVLAWWRERGVRTEDDDAG